MYFKILTVLTRRAVLFIRSVQDFFTDQTCGGSGGIHYFWA